MELTYLLIAAAIIVLPFVLTKLLSGKSRDATRVMGAFPAAGMAGSRAEAAAALAGRVRELLAEGQKIEAIKLVREATGATLEAAKDQVETLAQGGQPAPLIAGERSTVRLARELGDEVQHLVAQGHKIEAIRLVRERTGLKLKEAKELVDRLE